MMARSQSRAGRWARLLVAVCALALGVRVTAASDQDRPTGSEPRSSRPQPSPKKATATPEAESQALQKAFEDAAGNPQALIKNLQALLAQFPETTRRDQILRTILKEALQSNDPATAVDTGEKLLEHIPGDPALLSTLTDLLGRQSDPASRARAIGYATRLVERADKLATEAKPADVPEEKWRQAQVMLRATGYLSRGKIYADLGENKKAWADYERSFAASPSAQVAERLGDLASRMGQTDRAIEEYATAFAFPEREAEQGRREELRRKLGSIYVAKHHSEQGLGDLILAHYDKLARTFRSRNQPQGALNADVRDPFEYVLARPDGPEVRLADYRGKILVMDFWATWCEPCRVEGRLFEQVMDDFRKRPEVAFLAVNVDQDRAVVPGFIRQEGWTAPVVYGRELEQLLGVRALPTLVIFNRSGRVVFRQEGVRARDFVEGLETRVTEILRQKPGSTGSTSTP